jgi:phosphoheptose isomerase
MARYPTLVRVAPDILAAYELLSSAFLRGRKVLVCGNGGSAADAEHIVGELMKTMVRHRELRAAERQAIRDKLPGGIGDYLADHLEGSLPAMALVAQSSLMSAIQNDMGGDLVFAQQVFGYGHSGDVLWALSTSGRSRNVVLAAATALIRDMKVLAFTGPFPSPLSQFATITVSAPGQSVQEVQELHLATYHTICEALERRFFSPKKKE